MIRTLLLVTVVGFFVAVVALSSAFALAGPELAARNWEWTVDWLDDGHDWDHGHRDRHHGRKGPTVTRELSWDGSSTLALDIPADVEFVQAPGTGKLEIRGPRDVVDRVVLKGGRLQFDRDHDMHARRLSISITAPNVTRFELNGDDELKIRDFKQDSLTLELNGSSKVVATGSARAVNLELSGSGEADLGQVAAETAEVDIAGSGEAVVAPTRSARLDISGSGEVTLLTRPKEIVTDVTGSGRVIQGDAEEARAEGTET